MPGSLLNRSLCRQMWLSNELNRHNICIYLYTYDFKTR